MRILFFVFKETYFDFSPAADKPLPASPVSPQSSISTPGTPSSPPGPKVAQVSSVTSFHNARTHHRHIMKLDRCRSAENMTQLTTTPTSRLAALNSAGDKRIRGGNSNDLNSTNLMPSQSMEILREEETTPNGSPYGGNVTFRKVRTPVRKNSDEENNSTPNSSRRGSAIADKIR